MTKKVVDTIQMTSWVTIVKIETKTQKLKIIKVN